MSGGDDIIQRLVHVYGATKGEALYRETLERTGLAELRSPDDEMRFADALIDSGGLLEAMGRSLRVRALLRGASRAPRADRISTAP